MRTNLITNPSFEINTSGWTTNNATLTRNTTQAHVGTASGRMNPTGAGQAYLNGGLLTVEGSKTYHFSAYVYVPANLSVQYYLGVEMYQNFTSWGWRGYAEGGYFQNATSGWQRISMQFTTQPDATGAIPYLFSAGTPNTADVVFVDAVMVEVDSLGDYFDGDTTGYVWDGGAHASTSSSVQVFPEVKPGPANMRLEVETFGEGLPNLVQNPSGDLGTWGWDSPVDNTAITRRAGGSLEFTTNVAQAAYWTSELMPLAAGRYVGARFDAIGASLFITVKVRFVYYDANRNLISSSVQSPEYAGDYDVKYVSAVQAPANTAFVKIRFDMYRNGANPGVGDWFAFTRVMVTHAATVAEMGSTTRTNLVPNPSFETNLTGWTNGRAPDVSLVRSNATAEHGSFSAKLQQTGVAASFINLYTTGAGTSGIPVEAGADYNLSWYLRPQNAPVASRKARAYPVWYTETGAFIPTIKQDHTGLVSGAFKRLSGTFTAPSNAAYARVALEYHTTSGNLTNTEYIYIDGVMLEKAAKVGSYIEGTVATGAGYEFEDPHDWRNILGPTHEIKVSKNSLDVGLMSATVYDALLDPAVADFVRPGRRVRLQSLIDDTWQSQFEGTLSNARVTYEKDKMRVARPEVPGVHLESNLVSNPSFENGISNWSVGGNFSGTTVNAGAVAGNYVASITANADQINNGSFLVSSPIAAPSSGVVSMGVSVARSNTNAPTQIRLLALCYGASGYLGSAGQVRIDTRGGGLALDEGRIEGVSLLAGTTEFRLGLYPDVLGTGNDWKSGGTIRVDAAHANEGATLHPYFDGDSSDGKHAYAWTGTPHASSSTKSTKGKAAVPAKIETRIELTASDAAATLANQGESRGVANVPDLPLILEGKGVPWNVNGSGNQVIDATVVSYNENASVLDQIAVTRDSALGYAWVDRRGVLQAWNNDQLLASPMFTFSDAPSNAPDWASYTDIDVDFNIENTINDVTVNWLRYDIGNASTTEVPYGPYRNQSSIDTWGARSAAFNIQGATESETDIAAYAQAILDANGTPEIRCNRLTVPVRNERERAIAAVLDLYMPVAVKYDTKVDKTLRITGIEHTITPKKWTVDLTFDVQNSVAAPTWTPPPPFKGVGESEKPYRRVVKTNAQTVASGTWEPLRPNISDRDVGGIGLSYGVFTVPKAGVYRVSGAALFVGNNTGQRACGIRATGNSTVYAYNAASAGNHSVRLSDEVYVPEGGTIEFLIRQDSGSNLALNVNAEGFNFVTVSYVGS